jgi:hypothetical protein
MLSAAASFIKQGFKQAPTGGKIAMGVVGAGMLGYSYSRFSAAKRSPLGAGIGTALAVGGVMGGIKYGAGTMLKGMTKSGTRVGNMVKHRGALKSRMNNIRSPMNSRIKAGMQFRQFDNMFKNSKSGKSMMNLNKVNKGINWKSVAGTAGFVGGGVAMMGMGRRYSGA